MSMKEGKEGRKEERRDRQSSPSPFPGAYFNQSVTSVVAIKFEYVDAEDRHLTPSCAEGAPHLHD